MSEFGLSTPAEISDILNRMVSAHTLVTLSGPGGISCTTMLWSIDAERQTISFSAEPDDSRLEGLLESGEVLAVAYVDNIKVQFDVEGLILVHGDRTKALNAAIPGVIYRFQRRSCYRVKPLAHSVPSASLRHPGMPDMQLTLRVLDISLEGLALFLPDDVPAIPAGTEIGQCFIDLDSTTRLETKMVIHHVSVIHPDSHGSRLGCQLIGLRGMDERVLHHYIDDIQKRRLALAARLS
ncbi:flagellar brake protein [Aquabacterium sp.]|uniref:flagellar brake protein n=1 Tax=Aquabacterium sp. TaxID=1872578 RepID=UPI0035B3B4BB